MRKPELLAPAGDFEKLKAAVLYGADAVYIGGQRFGLRANAKNFEADEMARGIVFAHDHGCKVYVTANIFAHEADFDGMADTFRTLADMGADALIVADPGVFALAREGVPCLDIHISTQANITNARAARFWRDAGAKRVVLAREMSLRDITRLSECLPPGLETEAFVHGAMCVAYSGRCLLSAAMTGRSGNKGACAQPCRWSYALVEDKRLDAPLPVYEDERGAYILNARDLCMIEHVPALIKAGLHSFKIEGRMKSPYYVATVVSAYRRAIDDYFKDPALYESRKQDYVQEVVKASHRQYATGFYFGEPSQIIENAAYVRTYDFAGLVHDYDTQTQIATIEQRNKLKRGDKIEILRPGKPFMAYTIEQMTNEAGQPIAEAPHAQQIIKLKIPEPVEKFAMLRKEVGSRDHRDC